MVNCYLCVGKKIVFYNGLVESNESKLKTEGKSLLPSTEPLKHIGMDNLSSIKIPRTRKYAELINEALNNASNGMLLTKDIYKAISAKHSYYKMESSRKSLVLIRNPLQELLLRGISSVGISGARIPQVNH